VRRFDLARIVAAPPTARPAGRPTTAGRRTGAGRLTGGALDRWRYREETKRDRRLDLLRGYCVVAMAVDHLGGVATPLWWFTGGNRFFVSAAEGFLFISGLVMGLVYRPLTERSGLRAATSKAVKRAAFLYVMTVAATLGFMWLSSRLGLPWASGVDLRDAAPRVLLLLRTFYLTDVLMLYTFLVGVAPLAFWLMRHRLTPLLLGLSWSLWAYHQLVAPIDMPWPSEEGAFFYIVAWQALFMTGLAIGWHRQELVPLRRFLFDWRTFAVSGALVALFVWFWRSTWLIASVMPDVPDVSAWVTEAFAKWNLPPARMLACAAFFTFAFLLVHYLWRPIRDTLGRVLLPLGESALTAYVIHLVIVGLLTAYRSLPGRDIAGGTRGFLFQLFGVFLLWVAVRVWEGFRATFVARTSAGTLSRRFDPALGGAFGLVIALAIVLAPLPAAPVAGFVPVSPDRSSLERPHYFLHVPPDAVTRQPLPVLVVLHDLNEDPEVFGDELIATADREGWLLVAPRLLYQGDNLDPYVIAAESPPLLRGVREMIDELPSSTGLRLRRRAMLFGYGRGASVAERYALAYAPEVRSVALLGGAGYTVPPMDEIDEEPPFPFGVRGLDDRMGRPIDVGAIHRIRWWIGAGERDTDPRETSRAWDRFLGQTRVDRAERLATVLRRDGSAVELRLFPGVGYQITAEIRQEVADFIERTRSAAPVEPPREPPR
jgi:pimeloyl-ACP methyl ester carboxylesterase